MWDVRLVVFDGVDAQMIDLASITAGLGAAWLFYAAFFKDSNDFWDCFISFVRAFGMQGFGFVSDLGFFRMFLYLLLTVGSGFMTHYTLIQNSH